MVTPFTAKLYQSVIYFITSRYLYLLREEFDLTKPQMDLYSKYTWQGRLLVTNDGVINGVLLILGIILVKSGLY